MTWHFLEDILFTGPQCFFSCDFCHLWRNSSPPNPLSYKERESKGVSWKIQKWKLLIGGDPLVDDNFNEKIKKFKKANYKIALATTGLSFLKKAFTEIEEADLYILPLFSLDEKEHNQIAGIDSYNFLFNMAKWLQAKNKKFVFSVLVNRDNVINLREFIEFAAEKRYFLQFVPLPEISGIPGFDTVTARYINYASQQKNVWLPPLWKRFSSGMPRKLTACFSSESWTMLNKQPVLKYISKGFFWNLFVAKQEKWQKKQQKK